MPTPKKTVTKSEAKEASATTKTAAKKVTAVKSESETSAQKVAKVAESKTAKTNAKAAPEKVTPKDATSATKAKAPAVKKETAKPAAKATAAKKTADVPKTLANTLGKATAKKADSGKPAAKATAAKKVETAKPAPKPVAKKAEPAPKPEVVKPAKKVEATKPATAKSVASKAEPVAKTESAPEIAKTTDAKPALPSVRYSDEDLAEFEARIVENRQESMDELRMLKEKLEDLTSFDSAEESMIYSMHMAEQGSEAMEKEKTYAQIQRINEYIKKLDEALVRIKEKTYGICRVCGCLIAKERLITVPITTLSASYKIQKKCPEDGIDKIEPLGK